MPYIIETTGPDSEDISKYDPHFVTSRVAVATLDEARRVAESFALVDGFAQYDVYQHGTLSHEGGKVGPLPDGTVIEVRPITDREFAEQRLEYLRSQINAECISYGELAELQELAEYIAPDDMQLREWAGLPEFPENETERNNT